MNKPVFADNSRSFQTTDALLAACLYFAGVPFLDPLRPCVHRYDAKVLDRLGFKGMPLEEAAQKAWAARKRGQIIYLFKRPKEMPELLKAFHDEEKQIAEAEGTGAERLAAIMALDVMPEIRLVRAACLMLKMRLQFMHLWETQVPRLRIMEAFEPQQMADGTTRFPGWKEIPLNASDDLKRKMKL